MRSCISGTHGVKVTPFWAGTKPLIPGQCGQPLRNETERSHITYSRLPITRTFKRGGVRVCGDAVLRKFVF